ncbi:hypothetical protein SPRG_09865 [Saprolegnia parasitica CBS 223.65]|uniref:SPX domain-containing protein n=1 Tax=Saprolegnia parasitica (strain CBS 223.65) TaxID=695850 RepID=A0A067C0F3_SAPPC|nr:hypothetical protein SPRG_09865 [Saprolegnia parasitica CBS 223.65]KDO24229.1 hypothetical protein SPRG_09865 [Saprolegnia parasitica CBS 223.65]|eukprot:XP_012205005.1 hypothetical protein SPRG_09865 [Saprolegnia parasitica CBS 223.65]
MKFGKVLTQSIELSSSEYERSWVNYKQLKRIIKDCAQIPKHDKLKKEKLIEAAKQNSDNESIRESVNEMNFFRTLRADMAKIADFFVKTQQRYGDLLGHLETHFKAFEQARDANQDTKTQIMGACVALFKEMLLLENFALINYSGISKILKKHDKWTGYNTRTKFVEQVLNKQPFATYSQLLTMIHRVETIFMDATGSTITQHDDSTAPQDRTLELQLGYTMLQLSQKDAAPAVAKVAPSPTPSAKAAERSKVSLHAVHALRDESFSFKKTEESLSPTNSVSNSNSEDADDEDDGNDDDSTTSSDASKVRPKRKRQPAATTGTDSPSPTRQKMSFANILN